MKTNPYLKSVTHTVDVCIIGGGLAGMTAAISAARHGCSVVLMHDRPVLGGNCSSEIRMWPLGSHGRNNRETGIFEEILLTDMHRNPTRNFSIWDSVLYEKVRFQPNITLLLNCSCNDLDMAGDRIDTVRGWQLTTYTWHTVKAEIFIDCSGDSILAPMCGAEFRVGREASSEFGESIAPEVQDSKTMGLSCMIQARETDHPVSYIPPDWVEKFPDESRFPHRSHSLAEPLENYWWMELGGDRDSIHDTEDIRDDLLRLSFGVWDHFKNHGNHHAENWELDWAGFLPGKRESRRYVGDHIMTQNDVQSGGHFDDIVAYGGWKMDDHNPAGFNTSEPPTIYHDAPAPFGIPYRSMYSVNRPNLMFAGRNISATHSAMAASRVMATCAVIGQAVGTAASIAVRDSITPREIYPDKISELQQMLMDDDCWIPWHKRAISPVCALAELKADGENAENLRNGIDRPIGAEDNGCTVPVGSEIVYTLSQPQPVRKIRVIFDSDLNRDTVVGEPQRLADHPTMCNRPLSFKGYTFPSTMTRAFSIDYVDADGIRHTLLHCGDNFQRLVKISANIIAKQIILSIDASEEKSSAHIFSFDFE